MATKTVTLTDGEISEVYNALLLSKKQLGEMRDRNQNNTVFFRHINDRIGNLKTALEKIEKLEVSR